MVKIKVWFLELVARLNGPLFILVVNFIYKLRRADCSIKFSEGRLIVYNVKYEICIVSKLRYIRYLYGIEQALSSLTKNYFLNSIEFKEDDVIIDCGANIGELGVWIKSKNRKAGYYAFEPSPKEFACLNYNLKGSTDNVYSLGLWNERTTLKFYVASDTADSSLIEIQNFTNVIEVDVTRLDMVIPAEVRIKLLKVEAEGAEPEVLMGSTGLLSRCEYIVVDSSPERGINQEETTIDVINFLLANNFTLINMNHKSRVICLFRNKAF